MTSPGKVIINCAYCGKATEKWSGGVNRSRRIGAPLYCGKTCSGLARRQYKSTEQKKAEKQAYDAQYRADWASELKAEKRAYHLRTYDPVKAAEQRKKTMPRHVEYCRRPEYRAKKVEYDRQYRAKSEYGEFWESFLLAMDIRNEALRLMTDYEIRLENGTLNKSLERKRDYDRTRTSACPVGKEHEVGPLGNLERHQERRHAAGAG